MSRTPGSSTGARGSATNDVGSSAPSTDAASTLDWQTFCTAYFPGRRRHDLEALTAYGAYRRSRPDGAGSSGEGAQTGKARTSQRELEPRRLRELTRRAGLQ